MKHFPGFLITLLLAFFSINRASAYDFAIDDLGYNVISLSDLTCEVVASNKSITNISIPENVTYKNRSFSVIRIGSRAFYNSRVQSIKIPNSVTSIGENAFEDCSKLVSIEIPNSVTSIGEYAFYYCSNLVSIEIPNSVTTLRRSVFKDCHSLVSIKIPNSVTDIDDYAFDNCSSLKSIEIPNSVTDIDDYAFDFWNIESLTIDCELYFPSSYVNDSNYKFRQLKDLTLGEHTNKVQLDVKNCHNLIKITSHATTPPTGLTASNKQYMELEVKVPKGCLEAYQSAEGWKNFWNMSEMDEDESSVETVIADTPKTEIARYNLQGHKVGDDYRGLVIVKYSDGSTAKMINQ